MKRKSIKKNLSSKKKDIKCLSIDIGSDYIKFAVGQKTDKKLKVDKTFKVRMPTGAYGNGHIKNIQDMKSTIQGALDANSVKIKDVVCTIESTDSIKRELIVPAVGQEDLAEMVSYEIGQYLPIDIGSYVLQHKVIREIEEEENTRKYQLLVVALPKDIVKNIHTVFTEIGLNPYAMDIHSNGLDKIASEYDRFNDINIKDETVVFLDIGYETINVVILEKGKYEFNRLLKSGVKDFEQFNMQVKLTHIDEISLYLDVVDGWIDEIDKVFRYYTSRSVDNVIDRIFIYGGISSMSGLDRYISDRVNVPVEPIRSIDRVEIVSGSEFALAQSLNAVGAIIRL